MIHVYTGKPGAGKTVSCLHDLFALARKEQQDEDAPDRPIFVSGVRGFKPDHPDIADLNPQILDDPENWPDLPDGSIIMIDEAQRIYRPGTAGKDLPRYQTELETHRHRGIDIFMTTQGPHLLHSHVHPLVDFHIHMHWGSAREGAWRYEWPELRKMPRGQTAKDAATSARPVSFPKNTYDWYNSAELHTMKWRMPWRLLLKLSVPLLAVLMAVKCGMESDLIRSLAGAEPVTDSSLTYPSINGGADPYLQPIQASRPQRVDVDSLSYQELMTPEVEGEPWTAPIYRAHFLRSKEIPVPQCVYVHGTLRSNPDCTCYTQQAVRMETPFEVCRHIAINGWHDPTRTANGSTNGRRLIDD